MRSTRSTRRFLGCIASANSLALGLALATSRVHLNAEADDAVICDEDIAYRACRIYEGLSAIPPIAQDAASALPMGLVLELHCPAHLPRTVSVVRASAPRAPPPHA